MIIPNERIADAFLNLNEKSHLDSGYGSYMPSETNFLTVIGYLGSLAQKTPGPRGAPFRSGVRRICEYMASKNSPNTTQQDTYAAVPFSDSEIGEAFRACISINEFESLPALASATRYSLPVDTIKPLVKLIPGVGFARLKPT